jgi:putative phage-type endonuclease
MLTASMIHRIMGGTKGLDTVREEIRQWRKTGRAPRTFGDDGSSPAMEWGKRYEEQARHNVELTSGQFFRACGSIVHDDFLYCSASPDGLADVHGIGLEIKCPYNAENHLRNVEARGIPKAYWWQMQFGMWITGYPRWLFASFDPRRLAAGQDLHTILHWQERSERTMRQFDERIPWFWSTI